MPALVGGTKFRARLNMARLLGLCLARYLVARPVELPDLIVPVPLRPARMRERGYNQALEVARAAAGDLGLCLDATCCARVRVTSPQAGLEKRARRRNARGAIQMRRPLRAGRIAILDDVVTTGSTAVEIAKVLSKAGASRVEVWAVARTP